MLNVSAESRWTYELTLILREIRMNRLHLTLLALLFATVGCDTNRDHVPAGGAAPPAGGTAPAVTDDQVDTTVDSDAATSQNGNNTPRTSP